jgi:hypothetical protein
MFTFSEFKYCMKRFPYDNDSFWDWLDKRKNFCKCMYSSIATVIINFIILFWVAYQIKIYVAYRNSRNRVRCVCRLKCKCANSGVRQNDKQSTSNAQTRTSLDAILSVSQNNSLRHGVTDDDLIFITDPSDNGCVPMCTEQAEGSCLSDAVINKTVAVTDELVCNRERVDSSNDIASNQESSCLYDENMEITGLTSLEAKFAGEREEKINLLKQDFMNRPLNSASDQENSSKQDVTVPIEIEGPRPRKISAENFQKHIQFFESKAQSSTIDK